MTTHQEVMRETCNAMRQWIVDGTVPAPYLRTVLGDQAKVISPVMPVCILTEDDLLGMECPLPKEEGYE